MSALVHIEWLDPFLVRAQRFTRNWIRSLVEYKSEAWSIQIKWIKGDVTIGEAQLLVQGAEQEVLVPGNVMLVREGATIIAKLTVLSSRYDNKLIT